ncbi:MAG: dienelactone hydrolase family protein [Anaerolineales bacterium]|nr:dienelactone hydrolase family protein [Anaerolineales bacterium]
MDRVEMMELVRSRQVGMVSRREFLQRATAVLGSAVSANLLLAACTPAAEDTLPPVVDSVQPTGGTGTAVDGDLTTGIVTYPGPADKDLMGYLVYQTDAPPAPGVIVLQEWWGLNDHIKDVTRRFAREGFVALAPDLYHGVVTTEPNEARKLVMELDMLTAVSEIEKAVTYLKSRSFVSGGVGVVGFCMGGGLVLQTAVHSQAPDAGVAFYGSPLNPADAAKVSIPILSFLGTADNIPVSGVEAMHQAFDEAGVTNAYQIYDGAQHAFFNDTRSSYDPTAAADAWTRTLDWFRQHLSA